MCGKAEEAECSLLSRFQIRAAVGVYCRAAEPAPAAAPAAAPSPTPPRKAGPPAAAAAAAAAATAVDAALAWAKEERWAESPSSPPSLKYPTKDSSCDAN